MPTMRRISKDKLVDINDTLIQATVYVDDGCDWTAWNEWKMRERSIECAPASTNRNRRGHE